MKREILLSPSHPPSPRVVPASTYRSLLHLTVSTPSLEMSERQEGELVDSIAAIRKRCPVFRVLIIGRANAGKSSLLNALLGRKDLMKTSSKAVSRRVHIHSSFNLSIASFREGQEHSTSTASAKLENRHLFLWIVRAMGV